jgi:hypothetical protein
VTESATGRAPGLLTLLLTFGPLVITILVNAYSWQSWRRRFATLFGAALSLTFLTYLLLIMATGAERSSLGVNQQARAFGEMLGGLSAYAIIGLTVGGAGLISWWIIDRFRMAISERGNAGTRPEGRSRERISEAVSSMSSGSPRSRASARYCPHCGQRTVPESRFCHRCGADLLTSIPPGVEDPVPSNRVLTTRWKVILSVLGLLFVLALFGSGSDRTNRQSVQVARSGTISPATRTAVATKMAAAFQTATAQPTRAPRPTPSAAPTRTPTPTPLPGTHGNPAPFAQELTGGGARVKLLSGRFANEFGYSEPKGGYKYLVLDVRIEGAGLRDHRYGASNFSGEDADTGAGYDSAFVFGDDTLGSDTLSRGEYVTGTVVLEVQETAKRVIVKYDPAMFDTDDLYWIFE